MNGGGPSYPQPVCIRDRCRPRKTRIHSSENLSCIAPINLNLANDLGKYQEAPHGRLWIWSRNGEETGRVAYHAEERHLVLDYRVRRQWGRLGNRHAFNPHDLYRLPLWRDAPYFRCKGIVNGRHCLRRVGKVFAGGRYFLCRHCYNIAYTSQSEPRYDRMLRRANKIRTALGGEPGTANWVAPKPKGMWQRTYQRMQFEIEWCENQADQTFLSKFGHLLSAQEREMYFG